MQEQHAHTYIHDAKGWLTRIPVLDFSIPQGAFIVRLSSVHTRGRSLKLNRSATRPVYRISTRTTFHIVTKGPILKSRDRLAGSVLLGGGVGASFSRNLLFLVQAPYRKPDVTDRCSSNSLLRIGSTFRGQRRLTMVFSRGRVHSHSRKA
jgi:hypothetical protein